MRPTALTGLALTFALASAASADVLWDQSAIDVNAPFSVPNFTRTSAPLGPGNVREMFAVSDVTVPAGGWTINSISVFMADINLFFMNPPATATLNIFARTGASPTSGDNPRRPTNGGMGTQLSVSLTSFTFAGQTINQITASGLNIVLAPGDYWIGLTPNYSGGSNGVPNQWPAANAFGGNSYYRGANQATMDAAWSPAQGDGAILITGIPTPSAAALLGIAGLTATRRRRSK